VRSFIICTHPQISLGRSSEEGWGGQSMWHAWERKEKCTWFWWESPRESDHSQDQDTDGRMGSKWILGRLVGGVRNGFSWLRIGASCNYCEHGDEHFGSCATELASVIYFKLYWEYMQSSWVGAIYIISCINHASATFISGFHLQDFVTENYGLLHAPVSFVTPSSIG
jgi:hypothetical protein